MGTLVCFHAHPDDEAIATGGLMAKAAAAGHRVVLVCATRGEHGEPQPGVLTDGEQLWQRRILELEESARILGAENPIWLGYKDSGHIDTEADFDPASFWLADHNEASDRLAKILVDVNADVLTIYDDHGGYGHPDHIRVHTVGKAAAAIAGISNVLESTMNRDHIKELINSQAASPLEAGPSHEIEIELPDVDPESLGTAFDNIRYRVDVTSFVDSKRAAMAAHRSQIGPDSMFLSIPPEIFAMAFGSEWFNVCGESHSGGPTDVELLPGLN